MNKFLFACVLTFFALPAMAQTLPGQTTPGFDPVAPFFKPAADFNTAVQRTVGDSTTVSPTATAIGAPASIFNIGRGDATLTSVILGPIK